MPVTKATRKIPIPSPEQLAQEAAISEADIAEAKALVDGLSRPVKYLDGKRVRVASSKVLRWLWGAKDG